MNIRTIPKDHVNLFIPREDAFQLYDSLIHARKLIQREMRQNPSGRLQNSNETLSAIEAAIGYQL